MIQDWASKSGQTEQLANEDLTENTNALLISFNFVPN
jgi:hypothetical protein